MHSIASFFLAAAFVAISSAPVPASAAIIAWSGNTCNGNQGNNVPCDGSCRSFSGRHSFATNDGGTHCVTMFKYAGCPGGNPSEIFTYTGQRGQCTNVNTGTDIQSFICAPTNICLV